jgi:hypothetical protein
MRFFISSSFPVAGLKAALSVARAGATSLQSQQHQRLNLWRDNDIVAPKPAVLVEKLGCGVMIRRS